MSAQRETQPRDPRAALLEAEKSRINRKSSLLEYPFIRQVNDYFRPPVSGYLLYRDSEEKLLALYGLENSSAGIRVLSEKLRPFYSEIAGQNRRELSRMRVYSLLYTFKHISPTLPVNRNLNRLPAPLLKAYKVIFIFMVVFTFAGSVVHSARLALRRELFTSGAPWVLVCGLIWYFPAVNLYAIVLSDANRFRYPADMLIISLFTVMCYNTAKHVNRREKTT